jgi:hypothetical protein
VKLHGGKLRASSDAAELRWVPLRDVEQYALTMKFKEFFTRNYEKLADSESCPEG